MEADEATPRPWRQATPLPDRQGGEVSLLPCPFCGGVPEWSGGEQKTKYGNEQVYCPDCLAAAPPDGNKEAAAAWWNARASAPVTQAAQDAAREIVSTYHIVTDLSHMMELGDDDYETGELAAIIAKHFTPCGVHNPGGVPCSQIKGHPKGHDITAYGPALAPSPPISESLIRNQAQNILDTVFYPDVRVAQVITVSQQEALCETVTQALLAAHRSTLPEDPSPEVKNLCPEPNNDSSQATHSATGDVST